MFEDGQAAKLSSIPNEFRKFFEEVYKFGQEFRNLVEWDLPSFAALMVLQYLGVSEGRISVEISKLKKSLYSSCV